MRKCMHSAWHRVCAHEMVGSDHHDPLLAASQLNHAGFLTMATGLLSGIYWPNLIMAQSLPVLTFYCPNPFPSFYRQRKTLVPEH